MPPGVRVLDPHSWESAEDVLRIVEAVLRKPEADL
jgi:hypothetical protein